ncbi:alanine dehydrogenase [Catenovulum agarivorans DS-2]|uniref:Alanine dehydrogenase n=1 Tax=Catenovulum agarivorans DS-2 TaxID=1328313 RepID=W7QC08_9ALTE|nr:alanine dehydrogenase [Catenovulum agarivorans]EWH10394.1 alanine dehydrogenase [Catenovulum agarivorans DS-2]
MNIGVIKEIKVHEYRVGLTPASVAELVKQNHWVWIESGAGLGANFTDQMYQQAGAIVGTKEQVFEHANLIVKVKEPLMQEVGLFKPHHTLFTYLHLAANKQLTQALAETGATYIAYETVTNPNGKLPLLQPMSQIAGRLATQVGAQCLLKSQGGKGKLLSGLPGVAPAHVVVIGAGNVGEQAAIIAMGMQAKVTLLDTNIDRLDQLKSKYAGQINCVIASENTIKAAVLDADLVIGAVLVAGASSPKLVKQQWLKEMEQHSVLVDVAIDQGGCFETSRPTTHDEPTYEVDGIVHYCVTNMPGAVPVTSTMALNNATLPYVKRIAELGLDHALAKDAGLNNGVNILHGEVVYKGIL